MTCRRHPHTTPERAARCAAQTAVRQSARRLRYWSPPGRSVRHSPPVVERLGAVVLWRLWGAAPP